LHCKQSGRAVKNGRINNMGTKVPDSKSSTEQKFQEGVGQGPI